MYPITKVKYRDAKRCRVYEFDPARDIIILDTSALGFDHSAAYEDFIRAKGAFIIPQQVAQEMANHSDTKRFSSGRLSLARRSDTRGIRRISYNGPLITKAFTEMGGKPTAIPQTTQHAQERALLARVADLLPKHHAYLEGKGYFERWHDTFRTIAAYHEGAGTPLSLDDLRGAEAYRLLERALATRTDQPASLQEHIESIRKTNTDLISAYERRITTQLTTLAPAVSEGVISALSETLAEGYADALDNMLVRTLGNALDARYATSPADSAQDLRIRFNGNGKTTDSDVVMLSYTMQHDPKKNVHILAHDIDIRHLLHIRKVLNGTH